MCGGYKAGKHHAANQVVEVASCLELRQMCEGESSPQVYVQADGFCVALRPTVCGQVSEHELDALCLLVTHKILTMNVSGM